jgi:hypothetical protein
MLLIFMVDQTKIEYLRNERYSFFIWFFLGLVVAVSSAARREAQQGLTAVVPEKTPAQTHRTTGLIAVAPRPAVQPSTR